MENEVDIPTLETAPVEEETSEQERAPIKSVKTFWERLDEVLTLNLQSQQMRDKVEEILEQFSDTQKTVAQGSSFLFQPERVVISSNDDIVPSNAISQSTLPIATTTVQSSYFNSFRVKMKRALVGVKSIQLLSAVIPNAVQNIPDNSTIFFYYRLRNITQSQQGPWDDLTIYDVGDIVSEGGNNYVWRQNQVIAGVDPADVYWVQIPYQPDANSLPVWDATTTYQVADRVKYNNAFYICTTVKVGVIPGVIYWQQITLPANLASPNYYDIENENALQYVYLTPSTVLPEQIQPPNNNPLLFNRTFEGYTDLLASINYCATQAQNASIANDVTFQFNQSLNRFALQPLNIAAGYYYFPAGFLDPNVIAYLQTSGNIYNVDWFAQYTLNLRMGFTWNGLIPNVWDQDNYANNTVADALYNYMRPIDPRYPTPWGQNITTANSYGDLVNTSCVRVYADIALASTQDSNNINYDNAEGLLSIVPVNTNNLGVGFYQNNFNNELTKIPSIITEIGIRLVNDQGLPFYLPNSATVLLELAITYK